MTVIISPTKSWAIKVFKNIGFNDTRRTRNYDQPKPIRDVTEIWNQYLQNNMHFSSCIRVKKQLTAFKEHVYFEYICFQNHRYMEYKYRLAINKLL